MKAVDECHERRERIAKAAGSGLEGTGDGYGSAYRKAAAGIICPDDKPS